MLFANVFSTNICANLKKKKSGYKTTFVCVICGWLFKKITEVFITK